MPLRSVEAATRDDAIAAAREQFGPGARVIGVRRVRSGGVLGFFATERYVAEVDPDHPSRTAGRERTAARSSAVQAAEEAAAARRAEMASAQTTSRGAADRVSELAGLLGHDTPSAETAMPTYSRATVARPSAAREFLAHEPARDDATPRGSRPEPSGWEPSGWPPARTGSTRWEPARWEPARAEPPRPEPEPVRPAPEAFDWARFESARAGARPASPSASPSEPGSLRIRAGAAEPAPAPWSVAAAVLESEQGALRDGRDDDAPSTGASLPPSPFTAALARMVAGDRDVRKAVQAALDDRAATGYGRDDAEPPRPRSTTPVATPAKTGAGHQEEEPVEQDDVSTSLRTEIRPAEFPTWAEPEPVAEPVSRREEAIAEVLRAALAQGHSDEALTAILRKVLDGASPQAALTAETAAAAGPRVEARPSAAEVAEIPAAEIPLAHLPLGDLPAPAAPLDEAPGVEAAEVAPVVVDEEPVGYVPSGGYAAVELPDPARSAIVERPSVTTPAPSWLGSGLPLWGEPVAGAQLWGSTTVTSGYTDLSADEPIWAEVVLHEPAPVVEQPVTEELLAEEPVAEMHMVETPVVETPVVETPVLETPVLETPVDETPVVETPVTGHTVAEPPVVEPSVFEPTSAVEFPAVEATVEEPMVEEPALEEPTVAEHAAAEPAAAEAAPVEEFHTAAEPLTATLARTASDPAPMPLDATAVMPPLSLLPPLPSSGRRGAGLPPVPPMPSRSLLSPSRPLVGRPAAEAPTEPEPIPAPAPVKTLATVTRLPVAPLADLLDDAIDDVTEDVFEDVIDTAEEEPTMGEYQVAEPAEVALPATVLSEPAQSPAPPAPWAEPAPTVAAPAVAVPVPVPAPAQSTGLAGRLLSLGIPEWLLGPSFAADAALHGTYAALTRALGAGLPAAPMVPDGAGEVLFVVGPGVETLRAARSLAAWLRLDPDRVQWATRGDLAGLAPEYSRVTTIETAIERRQDATLAGTVTIVAVDAPLRTDTYWTSQMLAIWAPEAVWAVVDATRKPEDVEPWIDGLPRVDALMVEDTDLSTDPAAVLHRIAMPVALLDGVPATPHRWASLLCERLEKQQG